MSPSTASLISSIASSADDSGIGGLPDKPERRASRRSGRWSLAHDFVNLVRSASTASSTASHPPLRSASLQLSPGADTDRSTHDLEDNEHDPDLTVSHKDPIAHSAHLGTQMNQNLAEVPQAHRSRKAKIYDFISRSRSRSKSTTRRSSSKSSAPPDSDLTTMSDPDTTIDAHLTPSRHRGDSALGSKPLTRSPSRPLSNTTARTTSTITPLNAPTRARTPRAHQPSNIDTYAGRYSSEYDSRMPPPPVPLAKKKPKTPTLFGIPLPGRSRPTTPKSDHPDTMTPPQSPIRGRYGREDALRKAIAEGSQRSDSVAQQSNFTPIVAPLPRVASPLPIVARRTSVDHAADTVYRSQSSPPHDAPVLASEFTRPPSTMSMRSREGRCSSPLFALRLFGGSGSSSRNHSVSRSSSRKGKERAPQKERPQVSVPMLQRTRTWSKDNGPPSAGLVPNGNSNGVHKPKHGSFDFERVNSGSGPGLAGIGAGGAPGIKRTMSQSGADRRARASQPSHKSPHSQSTSSRAHAYRQNSRADPSLPPHSPLLPSASHHSHSTGTTATGIGAGVAGSPPGVTGSWGQKTRSAGWVVAGVHPPFAFESAASGSTTSNGRSSPAVMSEGRGKSRRHEERVDRRQASPDLSSRSRGEGKWQEREVELGLGLTWAPSKIRVREWTGGRDSEQEREREHERLHWEKEGERQARERLREFGYIGSPTTSSSGPARGKQDKEVTGRYKDVLGLAGFETFKKYVRRFDAEIIPLEGSSGLLVRVRRLLDTAPTPVTEREKREMLDDLVRIVRENEY